MSHLVALVTAAVVTVIGQWPASHRELRPVDEAEQCAGFSAFREELTRIIERRDSRSLLRVVDRDVHLTFGDSRGHARFRQMWLSGQPDYDLWSELRQVLELGGRCERGEAFTAPYVFTDWPEELEPHEFRAALGPAVPLRAEPHEGAEVVSSLRFSIVRLTDLNSFGKTWLPVQAPDGTAGFVSVRSVRSPIDMRAVFIRKNGSWVMTTWIGGD